MSSTMIFVVVAIGIVSLSSLFAGGLAIANSSQATAPPTFAPGAPPAGVDAQPGASPPADSGAGAAPQSNPFSTSQNVSPGTNTSISSPSGTTKPTGTTKPSRVLPVNGTYAPKKRGPSIAPRTAKPRKPSPKTTAPIKKGTRQGCRDAIYGWINGEVIPRVDTNVGYSTDTVWYDAYGGAGVRAACGGCVKKDEYGITVGKAVGVKRYNDEWDDTKRSKLREDSTRGWLADYMTSNMPDTC
jgi:hypothetical protein